MKIFITGIESFVGVYLANLLRKKKYQIYGIDKKRSASSTMKCDITSKNLYKIIPKNCDCLIHLAAISSHNSFNKNLKKSFNTNVNGTLNVVQNAIKKKIKQIIFASTEWVYGEDKISKIKNENSIISLKNISSDYAFSKILGEKIVEYYCNKNNINCTILRFGIVYGTRIKNTNLSAVENIINKILHNKKVVVGSKKTARRFIYIEDLCEALLKAVGLKGLKILNITGDQIINLEKIYKTAKKNSNYKLDLIESNKKKYNIRNIDNNNFKKLTKWNPKIKIEEGIKNIILNLKQNNKK